MRSIIFFTKSISFLGGKEKVLAALANYLCGRGYPIKIITYDGEINSIFPLHDKIIIQTIAARSIRQGKNFIAKLSNLLADIKAYSDEKKSVKQYDYFIPTDYLIATIIFFAFRGSAKKIISWEHLTYTVTTSGFWKFIKKKIYPRFHAVVALNIEETFFYKSLGCDVQCIPNSVQQQDLPSHQHAHFFVWVGGLTKDKGTDDLIRLGKILKEQKIIASVNIYGQGEEDTSLAEAITGYGLHQILFLKGIEKDNAAIYKNATALILTSKHECLPSVVLEAFSFGVPVVAFDCPTGPRNIIADGSNGFLIEENNISMMVEKMRLLLNDQEIFSAVSKNAYAVSRNYNPEKIFPVWEKLLV